MQVHLTVDSILSCHWCVCVCVCVCACMNCPGVYDASGMLANMRFMQAANVTGLPALVMPAGRRNNLTLPVG
jgi:Asp-tRNA(Asn)/Glu-tRNA(Gln) amidotransferase A subunit family amidase